MFWSFVIAVQYIKKKFSHLICLVYLCSLFYDSFSSHPHVDKNKCFRAEIIQFLAPNFPFFRLRLSLRPNIFTYVLNCC